MALIAGLSGRVSHSTMIAIALILVGIILLVVVLKWDALRQIYYLRKLPHPGLPWYLGGVLLPMICRRKRPLTSPEIVMPITLEWAKAHGGTFAAFLGLRPQIVTQDPAVCKYILKDNRENYKKNFGYDVAAPLIGMGLLRSRGALWQHQRKLLDPGFNHRYLARAGAICDEAAADLVRGWRAAALGGKRAITIDAREHCETYSMEVVTRFAFGGGHGDKARAARILRAFRTILRTFFVWMFVDMSRQDFAEHFFESNAL